MYFFKIFSFFFVFIFWTEPKRRRKLNSICKAEWNQRSHTGKEREREKPCLKCETSYVLYKFIYFSCMLNTLRKKKGGKELNFCCQSFLSLISEFLSIYLWAESAWRVCGRERVRRDFPIVCHTTTLHIISHCSLSLY